MKILLHHTRGQELPWCNLKPACILKGRETLEEKADPSRTVMAGLKSKRSYLEFVRQVDFCSHLPNLKNVYRGVNWDESHTQEALPGFSHVRSPDSLIITFLSQNCVFGQLLAQGRKGSMHSKHRGEAGSL